MTSSTAIGRAATTACAAIAALACNTTPAAVGTPGETGESTWSTGESGGETFATTVSDDTGDADTGGGEAQGCDFDLPAAMSSNTLETHLSALDQIAIDHAGNRAAGTSGYQASRDYVVARLLDAGYEVEIDPFEFLFFGLNAPSVFEATAGPAFVHKTHWAEASYSGSGDVTATATAVDLQLGLGNGSTSGCEPDDFIGFPAGDVALIQRGTCVFSDKIAHATDAGAVAVLIFNQGDTVDRQSLTVGSIGADGDPNVPVLFLDYATGETLANAASPAEATVHVQVDATTEPRNTHNILATHPRAHSQRRVMLGAHLDSVTAGAGVNDNGSGSSLVLALAEAYADCEPEHAVTFAWWGAEELGLLGSRDWVATEAANHDVALYLNFDMVASPNYAHFVHDGDGSTFNPGPGGSDVIEAAFRDWFDTRGIEPLDTAFSGRSDYAAFADAGIPVGGLATGAGSVKTDEAAAMFGGVSGDAYDGCYHQACDTLANIAADAHIENLRAAAAVLERFAMDVSDVVASPAPPTRIPLDVSAHHEHATAPCGGVDR